MRVSRSSILIVALSLASGCSSGGDRLQGSVTYNGAPVKNGYITFSPVGSGTSLGAKIADGLYQIDDPRAGQYKVMVRAEHEVQAARTREEAARQAAANPSPQKELIPENAQGNGQTVEITSGEQTLDFALTGPAS